MRLSYLFLALALMVTPACDTLKGLSVATTDCLINPEDVNSREVLVIPTEELPTEIAESEKLEGKKVIIAPVELLKPECTQVPLVPQDQGWMGWALSAVGAAVGVASLWIPKLAMLEGFLALLSRRKRQHYVAAAKSALPYDGTIDMKGAVTSLGKALGILHTNGGSEQKAPQTPGSDPQAA
jgi:hypothetical protein